MCVLQGENLESTHTLVEKMYNKNHRSCIVFLKQAFERYRWKGVPIVLLLVMCSVEGDGVHRSMHIYLAHSIGWVLVVR